MRQVLTKKEYLGNLLAFSGGSYTSAEPAERHSVFIVPVPDAKYDSDEY